MRAIASIGLILLAGAGLITAPRRASSEIAKAAPDHQLVVLPAPRAGAALQLASFGVAELTPDDGFAIAVLHVRAVIANTTRDRPWSLDIAKARMEVVPGAAVAPAFANSDLATLPIAIIDPGERRTIDLYFPLAPDLARRGGPASFALSWPVHAPDRVTQYAWFARNSAIAQSGRDVALAAGWGRHWWFDPAYPWEGYHHRDGRIAPRPPSYVAVTGAPHWAEKPVDLEEPPANDCQQW